MNDGPPEWMEWAGYALLSLVLAYELWAIYNAASDCNGTLVRGLFQVVCVP